MVSVEDGYLDLFTVLRVVNRRLTALFLLFLALEITLRVVLARTSQASVKLKASRMISRLTRLGTFVSIV